MSDNTNPDYFARRAAEERARAQQASDERVAAAHAEMAAQYEARTTAPSLAASTLRVVSHDAGASC